MEWKHKVGMDVLKWMEARSSARLPVIVQHNSAGRLPEATRALKIRKCLPQISAFMAELTGEEISFLASQPCIIYISYNRSIKSCLGISRKSNRNTLHGLH